MLLALVALTGAAACNGGGSGTAERSTTTTTRSPSATDTTGGATEPTTTPPPGDEKEAVKAAYLRFWMVVDEYGKRTGKFDPVDAKTVLGAVASDGEYDHLFNTFQLNRLKGLVYREGDAPDEFAPVVTIEGPGRASVRDCRTDRGGVFKEATGERVDTPTDGRRLFEVVLVRDGEEWKVSSVGGRTNPEDPPCTV
jgi:hypothetical protein